MDFRNARGTRTTQHGGADVEPDERLDLERQWHDAEHFARDDNSLIVRVYSSPVFEEAEAYLFAALGNIDGQQVLDYGSGTGETAERLARQGALVTGFDISGLRLQAARARFGVAFSGTLVQFTLCAAENLPFADASFDAVLGKQILHHLDLKLAIPEIARVLRPGGHAVFLEPLVHNPLLQGYRRLTPHLRSPTERALSIANVRAIGRHFRSMHTREFCLFAVVPVLIGAVTRPAPILDRASVALRRLDRRLMDGFPFIARFAWETVIVVEK